MRKFVQNKKMTEKNLEDLKVKEYMNKYIKELQRHFDMSDKRMRLILYKIYKESSPVNIAKKFFKNYINMIKSFCNKKIISKGNIK